MQHHCLHHNQSGVGEYWAVRHLDIALGEGRVWHGQTAPHHGRLYSDENVGLKIVANSYCVNFWFLALKEGEMSMHWWLTFLLLTLGANF